MMTPLFTAAHPHSCLNRRANFVSPQPETVTDTYLVPGAIHCQRFGTPYQLIFQRLFFIGIMARFKVKSALTNPCFPTLTEMKGQDVCVKMKLGGSSVLTEQIDIKMESIPL